MSNQLKNAKSIYLHKIKEGKHTFKAKVKEIKQGMEWLGSGTNGNIDNFVYFKDINVLLKGKWYSVNCCGNSFRAKLEKELSELNLKPDDTICFNAEAIDDLVEFLFIEGRNEEYINFWESTGDINTVSHDEPFAILPKSYKGNIAIGYCEAFFDDFENITDRMYKIFKQVPRCEFDIEYPQIINEIRVSAQKDAPDKRLSMFYYNPLFTRFFNFSKLQ